MTQVGLGGPGAQTGSLARLAVGGPYLSSGLIALGFVLLLAGIWPRGAQIATQDRGLNNSSAVPLATVPATDAPSPNAEVPSPSADVEGQTLGTRGQGDHPNETPLGTDSTLGVGGPGPRQRARDASRASRGRRSNNDSVRLEFRFPLGSARFETKEVRSKLKMLLRAAERCPKSQVLVEGHADSVGDRTANLQLSWRRARAVARRLKEAGIAGDRLVVRAFGHYQPKASVGGNDRAQRRVEVRLSGCSVSTKGDAS